MTPARRRFLLFALLAASAFAVGWDRLRAKPVAVSNAVVRAPAARANNTPAPAHPVTPAIALLHSRDDYLSDGGDAFPPLNPPPPPVAAVPTVHVEPPRPTAPAVPFTVIGKKLEAGTWEVYLAKGDQTYVARQGDVVADDYRVNAIAPSHMTLIYLPLNEPQTLQTGAPLQ